MQHSVDRRRFNQSLATGALIGLVSSSRSLLSQERSAVAIAPSGSGRTAIGRSVAATVHPLASQAALEIYRKGGNAIDAAIAAALCLGVVDGHNSGIGGGCLMLIRTKAGAIHAIDGRETASEAAYATMYERNGKPVPDLSQTGSLACAVPGQIAALKLAHDKLGTIAWAKLFEPAIAAAENGHAINRSTHNVLLAERTHLANNQAARSVLLNGDGSVPAIGETLIQLDLANTLKQIATFGTKWFYVDGFAKTCCDYLESQAGILSRADFANYKAIERSSVRSSYRGFQIIGFPTPSSGGIHIAQMLNMLQQFDVASIHSKSPGDFFHLLIECMKRAFADRAHWLGDSDFVDVPRFLLDPDYAKKLASQIRLDRASTEIHHGSLPADDSKKHTTHLATADEQGNWVALTSTVNTGFGSKVMIPGTGVILNNEMDDFSIAPGVPNAFGLVGSQANAIAPGKRPLSSMSPTIVLHADGTPLLSCGAAGGPKIINATLQTLVRYIDLGQRVDVAIGSARVHHQWSPDVVQVEPNLGGLRTNKSNPAEPQNESILQLEKLGHPLKHTSSLAIVQGIQMTSDGLLAAADPRAEGEAISYP